jgi:hypothetical protein
MQSAYSEWCRVDGGAKPRRVAEWLRNRIVGRVARKLIPLALRIDADAATTQMIEGAWWG